MERFNDTTKGSVWYRQCTLGTNHQDVDDAQVDWKRLEEDPFPNVGFAPFFGRPGFSVPAADPVRYALTWHDWDVASEGQGSYSCCLLRAVSLLWNHSANAGQMIGTITAKIRRTEWMRWRKCQHVYGNARRKSRAICTYLVVSQIPAFHIRLAVPPIRGNYRVNKLRRATTDSPSLSSLHFANRSPNRNEENISGKRMNVSRTARIYFSPPVAFNR